MAQRHHHVGRVTGGERAEEVGAAAYVVDEQPQLVAALVDIVDADGAPEQGQTAVDGGFDLDKLARAGLGQGVVGVGEPQQRVLRAQMLRRGDYEP